MGVGPVSDRVRDPEAFPSSRPSSVFDRQNSTVSAARSRPRFTADAAPRLPPQEQLLVDALVARPERTGARVLSTGSVRGQVTRTVAERLQPGRNVGHFLDSFRWRQAQAEPVADGPPPDWVCQPDLPPGDYDLALLPVEARGEAELTRDWLQQMHRSLVPGGELLAATNNPDDQWLHHELQRLFGKVTRTPAKRGVLYGCRRSETPVKYKAFDCELAFRDEGRLIPLFTRPGVFSHRTLDTGARVLMESLSLADGHRVVDLGCGSGAVGIAAALRAPEITVLALDSNPRAIECTQRGAAASGITNLTAVLDDTGQGGAAGQWDLVLGNPPYFSEYKIAEIFLEAAQRLLSPGGQVRMVTKTPQWFEERMPVLFDDIESRPSRAYHLVSGRQREPEVWAPAPSRRDRRSPS